MWLPEAREKHSNWERTGQRKDTFRQGHAIAPFCMEVGCTRHNMSLQNLGSRVSLDKRSSCAPCGGSGTQKEKLQWAVCHLRYFSCFQSSSQLLGASDRKFLQTSHVFSLSSYHSAVSFSFLTYPTLISLSFQPLSFLFFLPSPNIYSLLL